MFPKNSFFMLAIFLMTSTKIELIGCSASPDLIRELKRAYAYLDYWIKQDAISVKVKSWIMHEYYVKYCEHAQTYEHQLVPVMHVSYQYDFEHKAAQSSFERYRDLSSQLANRQLFSNFKTGCMLGIMAAFCQKKLVDKITTKQALMVLLASSAGVSTWDYDLKSDLPFYDLLTLEAWPSAGKTATIARNTLVATVFAAVSYLITQGGLAR